MFQYKWNEIISHFIGIFEVKTEEARLRSEYDEFRAHVARLSEQLLPGIDNYPTPLDSDAAGKQNTARPDQSADTVVV